MFQKGSCCVAWVQGRWMGGQIMRLWVIVSQWGEKCQRAQSVTDSLCRGRGDIGSISLLTRSARNTETFSHSLLLLNALQKLCYNEQNCSSTCDIGRHPGKTLWETHLGQLNESGPVLACSCSLVCILQHFISSSGSNSNILFRVCFPGRRIAFGWIKETTFPWIFTYACVSLSSFCA